jgi:hypothetical protein
VYLPVAAMDWEDYCERAEPLEALIEWVKQCDKPAMRLLQGICDLGKARRILFENRPTLGAPNTKCMVWVFTMERAEQP